jgi:hypothetical protein
MTYLERGPADLGGGAGVRIGWSALWIKGNGFGSGGDSLAIREERKGPTVGSGGAPVPDSVEARLVWGKTRLTVQVKRDDWMEMQDLGMMLHPGLVVGLAWRRSSPGRRQLLPAIRPVSPKAMEIPMRAWPSTWEGLVEHVRQGGPSA